MQGSINPVVHTVPPHALTRLAREWLSEDAPSFDPAGACVGTEDVEARLLCKSPHTVLAGSPFFTAVFAEVGCTVDWIHQEGAEIGLFLIRQCSSDETFESEEELLAKRHDAESKSSLTHRKTSFLFNTSRSGRGHPDSRGERPGEVPPPRGASGSELPGPGLGHRHPLLATQGAGEGGGLARGGGGHEEDHAGLSAGGEVRHAGGRGLHAQAGPERDGDAEGQPHLGIRKHHGGGGSTIILQQQNTHNTSKI